MLSSAVHKLARCMCAVSSNWMIFLFPSSSPCSYRIAMRRFVFSPSKQPLLWNRKEVIMTSLPVSKLILTSALSINNLKACWIPLPSLDVLLSRYGSGKRLWVLQVVMQSASSCVPESVHIVYLCPYHWGRHVSLFGFPWLSYLSLWASHFRPWTSDCQVSLGNRPHWDKQVWMGRRRELFLIFSFSSFLNRWQSSWRKRFDQRWFHTKARWVGKLSWHFSHIPQRCVGTGR